MAEPLGDAALAKEFLFRVIASRWCGEEHLPCGSLAGLSVHQLLEAVSRIHAAEPVHLELSGSYLVVGDLHGNIDDLLRIVDRFPVQEHKYLFLGDYVDRGRNSIETILVLYALKVLFPESVYLLRGNHECSAVSRNYGFKAECSNFFRKRKTYRRFCTSFTFLPISATVNRRTFCVHGGLSPSVNLVSEISEQIEKPLVDIGSSVAEDLLWSDPCYGIDEVAESQRGVGCVFGRKKLKRFLRDNRLTRMIRAHEFCVDGTESKLDGCITVFSACDYCGRGNDAAVVVLKEDESMEVCVLQNRAGVRCRIAIPEWLFDDCSVIKGLCDTESDPIRDLPVEILLS